MARCKIAWVKSGAFFSWGHFDFVEENVLIDEGIVFPEGKLFEGIALLSGCLRCGFAADVEIASACCAQQAK